MTCNVANDFLEPPHLHSEGRFARGVVKFASVLPLSTALVFVGPVFSPLAGISISNVIGILAAITSHVKQREEL